MIGRLHCSGDALLGEGPRVIETTHGPRVVWVDLLRALVLGRGVDGRAATLWHGPESTLSAVIPLARGGFVATLHRSLALLDAEWRLTGTMPVPDLPAGLRLSDATAGPDGAVWVGAVPTEGSTDRGGLYRITSEEARIALPDIGFSNGLGFRADGRALFLVDSAANTVTEYPVDPATGAIGDGRVVYTHGAPGEALDGLAVDAHDRPWVAVFGGGRVLAIDPATGSAIGEVTVPATRVTSCAFGPDQQLYVTTATVEQTAGERENEPLAGSVFACAVGVAGGPVGKGVLE